MEERGRVRGPVPLRAPWPVPFACFPGVIRLLDSPRGLFPAKKSLLDFLRVRPDDSFSFDRGGKKNGKKWKFHSFANTSLATEIR